MTTYFALTDAGDMVKLGDFPTFDEADNYCYDEGINTVWIYDADVARDWVTFLDYELGESK